MTRVVSNAFNRSARRQSGRDDLTGFAPLSAQLKTISDGVRLTLSPMRAIDLLPVWSRERGDAFCNVMLSARPARTPEGRGVTGSLARLVRQLQLDHTAIDAEAVVLRDAPLVRLLSQVEFSEMTLVRIEGPVEADDVFHIRRALSMDGSALEADLRATQAVRVDRDEFVTFDAREPERADALVAENFRHYVAATLNQPLGRTGVLEPWHIRRLLGESGALRARTVETQVYSTSVDIGIATQPAGTEGPANRSLIYDRPSESWHDEA